MLFTDRLFKKVEPVWNSYLEHPFVNGIGEGTVDKEKYMFWDMAENGEMWPLEAEVSFL